MSADPFFDDAMAFFWLRENDGQPLHVSPHDPGGATSWGVVYTYWSAWRRQHGEQYGYNDFCKATKEDFRPYLYSQYWLAAHCQALGAVGLPVFDFAGTSGVGWAAKLLQRELGVKDDGAIGPQTLEAFAKIPALDLIKRYTDRRIAYYQSLPDARFFVGWVPRAKRSRDYALSKLPAPDAPKTV